MENISIESNFFYDLCWNECNELWWVICFILNAVFFLLHQNALFCHIYFTHILLAIRFFQVYFMVEQIILKNWFYYSDAWPIFKQLLQYTYFPAKIYIFISANGAKSVYYTSREKKKKRVHGWLYFITFGKLNHKCFFFFSL